MDGAGAAAPKERQVTSTRQPQFSVPGASSHIQSCGLAWPASGALAGSRATARRLRLLPRPATGVMGERIVWSLPVSEGAEIKRNQAAGCRTSSGPGLQTTALCVPLWSMFAGKPKVAAMSCRSSEVPGLQGSLEQRLKVPLGRFFQ
eukprot:6470000-Amphidinium_carterae.4